MKCVKKLALMAVASAAVVVLGGVGSASATSLTCGSGTLCAAETAIKAESEGKATLDAPFGNVECNSTIEGHTTKESGSADGPITSLTFTNCGGDTVTVLANGSVSAASGGQTSTAGIKITVIHTGIHCIYETNNTVLGTATGSSTTGGNATIDVSATIPRVGGTSGVFCGSSAPLTGNYKITSPSTLDLD
ncbi:MAG: hypothetical protein ACTHK6_07380 [Solirubrobacterales bacterium]